MKRNNIHTLCMAVALPILLASCQEDLPDIPGKSDVTLLTITVTDGGYGSTDNAVTRAAENGYRTEFTAGDACGLYIVRNGRIISENIRIQASSGDGGQINWTPDSPIYGGLEGESVFLYYPYQYDMTDKVSLSATDDADFFAPLISAWQPATDQSNYRRGYAPSDLMTSKGKAVVSAGGKLNLSFTMTHRMALAVIDMPLATFKFTDSSFPDYTGRVNAIFPDNGPKAYRMDDGTFRYIVNPAINTTITGSFFSELNEFSFTNSGIAAGSYKTFRVDANTTLQRTYTMQPGDYFCQKNDGSWYLIPREAIPDANVEGVVFYKGIHPTDKRSYYNTPLNVDGPKLPEGVFHGYVLSLITLEQAWSTKERKYGSSTSQTEWNGYSNCHIIHNYVGNHEDMSMENFPAFYACENYTALSPVNTSGWFLPSVAQISEAWRCFKENNDVARSVLSAGGDNISTVGWVFFWTSTESGDQFLGYMYASSLYCATGKGSDKSKTASLNTRAILAF